MMSNHPMKEKYVMTLLIFSILLLFTGCGNVEQSEVNNESDWEDGEKELSDQIGAFNHESEKSSIILDDYREDYMDIFEQTTYDQPTSKWFIHHDEGILGYEMPSGTMEAGETYKVKLFSHEDSDVQVDRDVRIKLSSFHPDHEQSELLAEDIVHLEAISGEEEVYSSHLPDEENVVYIVSLEILDQQGDVEDTMVRMIYVPKPEINAKLSIDEEVYTTSDKEAILTLKNAGPTFLTIGEFYTIEKKVKDQWKIVPLEIGFEDIGIFINPESVYKQHVMINELLPGEYRVIKTIYADGLDLTATLAARFKVE